MASTPAALTARLLSIFVLGAVAPSRAAQPPSAESTGAGMAATPTACVLTDLRRQSAALRKSLLRTQRHLDEIRPVLARIRAQAEVAQGDRDGFYGIMQALSRALRALRVDGALFTQRTANCAAAGQRVANTMVVLAQGEQAFRALHLEMIRGEPQPKSIESALQGARDGLTALHGAQDELLNGAGSMSRTAAATRADDSGETKQAATAQ